MVIAHLPAGYLLTKHLQSRFHATSLLWAGLLGSILPDFDILYFYLVDAQQVSHRSYITHWPLFWLGVAYLVLPFVRIWGSRVAFTACVFLFANIGLHMLLDSVMAPVYWLQPYSEESFQLLKLKYTHAYSFWLWNYMAHPAFLMEIAICIAALLARFTQSVKYLHFREKKA